MTARLAGRDRPAAAADVPRQPRPQRWLGLDPSLRGTGWGVVHFTGDQPALVACGVWKCPPAWPRTQCLAKIATAMEGAIRDHRPEVCAVEALFFAQNHRTTLVLGEARGAALAGLACAGIPIYELAPRRVKLAIAGHGAAGKPAVGKMVKRLLSVQDDLATDATDALAVALACAHLWNRAGHPGPKAL